MKVEKYGWKGGEGMYLAYVGRGGSVRILVETEENIYIVFHYTRLGKNYQELIVAHKTQNINLRSSGHQQVFTANPPKQCAIKMVIGPLFYKLLKGVLKFETQRQLLSQLKLHINAVMKYINTIYGVLPFPLNMEFRVKTMLIIPDHICKDNTYNILFPVPIHMYCNESTDSYQFLAVLNTFGWVDHQYCLVISTLNHPGMNRIIGLAYMTTFCNFMVFYRSLIANPSSRHLALDAQALAIIMAHEIAHTLSAEHDNDCVPPPIFNYIMSSVNYRIIPQFSNCSIAKMYQYVFNERNTCFNRPTFSSVCGNGILEVGETCDCGASLFCSCCDKWSCHLTATSKCSPFSKFGMCCDNRTCTWYPRSKNIRCSTGSECESLGYCEEVNGCSPDSNEKTQLLCNSKSKVCKNKVCENSVCSLWQNEECPSSFSFIPSCVIHCRKSANEPCVSVTKLPSLPELKDIDVSSMHYAIGSICNDSNFFCDSNGICTKFFSEKLPASFNIVRPLFYDKMFTMVQKCIFLITFQMMFFICITILLFQLPYLFYKTNFFGLFIENSLTKKVFIRKLEGIVINDYNFNLVVENMNEISHLRSVYNYLYTKQSSLPVSGILTSPERLALEMK